MESHYCTRWFSHRWSKRRADRFLLATVELSAQRAIFLHLEAEKSLYWIEGTERRFDGYNFFGLHPEIPIEWFDKHVD